MTTTTKRTAKAERPMDRLKKLSGVYSGSIGQWEALAGINVQSQSERKALWDQFRDLFNGDAQTLTDAVMDHCAQITLKRIKRGEMCLLPAARCY